MQASGHDDDEQLFLHARHIVKTSLHLGLPSSTTLAACEFLNRALVCYRLDDQFHPFTLMELAMACLSMGWKADGAEDNAACLMDSIAAYWFLKFGALIPIDDDEYEPLRGRVTNAEFYLMQVLGIDGLFPGNPAQSMVEIVLSVTNEDAASVVSGKRAAYRLCLQSAMTRLCLTHTPKEIGAAALYLAHDWLGAPDDWPTDWLTKVGLTYDKIKDAVTSLIDMDKRLLSK